MEKIVNDIYSDCQQNLSREQVDSLVEELEQLSCSKYFKEVEEKTIEEDPNQTVARENMEAIS